MTRGIIFGAIAFAIAYYAENQFVRALDDMRRYDKLRAMSGEEPFLKEQFARISGLVSSFVGEQASSRSLLGSVAADIVRYAKLNTM